MNARELGIALAFAKLELVELEAGKRTLTQCPGLERVAEAIAEAKDELAQRVAEEAKATECGAKCSGHRAGRCSLPKGHKGAHFFPNMWNDM